MGNSVGDRVGFVGETVPTMGDLVGDREGASVVGESEGERVGTMPRHKHTTGVAPLHVPDPKTQLWCETVPAHASMLFEDVQSLQFSVTSALPVESVPVRN